MKHRKHPAGPRASPLEATRGEQLRRSEERLSRAQAMAHVGDWEWDVATNQVSWSDEVYRVYGYEPREVAPNYDLVLKAMHPSTKESFLAAIDAALKGERPFEMDYDFLTRDGVRKTLHTIGTVFRDAAGRPLRMAGTIQDITDRTQVERALRESEGRFRCLFEAAPDAGLLADVETGRVIDVNPAACRLLGRAREEIIGLHQTEVHPPRFLASYREAFRDHVRQSLENGDTRPLQGVVLRADGVEVPVEILARRIEVEGRPVLYGVFRDVSSRRQAEAALRESEARYHDLFENANDAIFILDTDQRYVEVNRRATELFGYSREEFLALGLFDLIPAEQVERSRAAFRDLRERGAYERFEGRLRTKDGRWLDIEVSSSAIVCNGAFAGSRDTVRDVTAQKEAQERLQHSQELLNRAEEIAGLGSWEWDVASNRLTWSDEVFRIYGLDPARTVPTYQVVVDMVHPANRAEFLRATEATLSRDEPFNGQYAVVRPDGTVRFTHTKAELVRDAAGRPVKLVGVVQDISERKRSETFIQDILETVDEGFLIIDREYRILSANRAYAVQAGRDLKEIIGKKCHAVSHGLTCPCHEAGEDCAVLRVFQSGEAATALHTHHDAAGNPIYVETKAFPMTDPTGQVSAAIEIVNNITEKRKLEDQYRQAQKMEAVALLAGGVAHDFNNLLTAITGYAHLLSLKLDPGDPLRGHAEQILGAAERAASLTQSLMAFGRRQVVNPVPVDLNEVVAGILKLLQRVIGEDVELVTEPSPEPCTVLADRSQIEQVLMNLATNARDAMPGGGVLGIRTARVVIDDEFLRKHGFGQEGPWACLRVSDTGVGMDRQTQARIFEPFFTTKELGRGTGLGLASVYGIVKQSRGYITVESEPGRGTSFSILLPLVPQAEARTVPAAPPAPGTGNETVLLAEDDPVLRDLLKNVLVTHGYTVIEAVNGEEAIDRFRENRDRVDLAILDVVMPKKNGKEVQAAIASARPGMRTLFISGYSNHILDHALLQGMACRYLAKPVSPPVFLNTVRDILDGR